jgi:hypothetical protein
MTEKMNIMKPSGYVNLAYRLFWIPIEILGSSFMYTGWEVYSPHGSKEKENKTERGLGQDNPLGHKANYFF